MAVRPVSQAIASGALCALVLAAAGVARAEETWTPFTSKGGGFSVEVPAKPTETETHEKSFIGTITNHILTSEAGKDRFTVDYSDIPHMALRFAGADTIYSHAEGALLKKTFSKSVSNTDVTIGGHKGKQLIYDTPPVDGHPEMRGDAILLLVDDRLYVIDAVVPESESEEKAKRFLASFALTK